MLSDVDIMSDEQFQRRFNQMNKIWLIVACLYTGSFVYGILNATPRYLHDWRGVAIIGLSAAIVGLYALRTASGDKQWPPNLRYSLPLWFGMYLSVVLLSLIVSDFVYLFYIVFGISFSLFGSRRLLLMVAIIMLTLFAFQGLLTLPITSDHVISVVGQGVGIAAMTAFSMISQHLISERYARNRLVQELTEANTRLEDAHRQLAASVVQEQELAVLRERTRLARDMHDTLGHALVLIAVKLEAAQRLRAIDVERCDHELEATKEIVRDSMKELRASIANLRSPALEHKSACCAITRYADEVARRTGWHITYDLQPDIEALPEQVEEILWKVGQEALTNVEKHARASNVVLHMSRRNGHICLSIQDDGIGLPLALVQWQRDGGTTTCTSLDGHYGLSGMFERVERIGGHITLHPSSVVVNGITEPCGTVVEVALPLVGLSKAV